MNKKLFKFYVSYLMSQFKVWSMTKIYAIKDCDIMEVDGFVNYKFSIRGSANEEFLFSFVELPLMNPHDCLIFFNILSKDKTQYVNRLQHLKIMIKFYCLEIFKIDIEVTSALNRNKTVEPSKQPCNIEQLCDASRH